MKSFLITLVQLLFSFFMYAVGTVYFALALWTVFSWFLAKALVEYWRLMRIRKSKKSGKTRKQ
jgi:hypothetical protein